MKKEDRARLKAALEAKKANGVTQERLPEARGPGQVVVAIQPQDAPAAKPEPRTDFRPTDCTRETPGAPKKPSLPSMKTKKERYPMPFRLPDGAAFHAVYDAKKNQWQVTLMVSESGHGNGLHITQFGPALHPTIMRVGQMWFQENRGE